MEKAYDLKALGEKIKSKAKENGLDIAEEAIETLAKAALAGTLEWADESAKMTPTPIDNIAVEGLKYLQTTANAYIEKIDLDGDGK